MAGADHRAGTDWNPPGRRDDKESHAESHRPHADHAEQPDRQRRGCVLGAISLAIVDAADEAGMSAAAAILNSLAEWGTITEVMPGTAQAREFAESHRLQSSCWARSAP